MHWQGAFASECFEAFGGGRAAIVLDLLTVLQLFCLVLCDLGLLVQLLLEPVDDILLVLIELR